MPRPEHWDILKSPLILVLHKFLGFEQNPNKLFARITGQIAPSPILTESSFTCEMS